MMLIAIVMMNMIMMMMIVMMITRSNDEHYIKLNVKVSKGNIYVKNTAEETAVSNDILKLPNGLLDMDKPFKLFDMKKFQQNVNREMKRQFPERNKLETQVRNAIGYMDRNAIRNMGKNTRKRTRMNIMCGVDKEEQADDDEADFAGSYG